MTETWKPAVGWEEHYEVSDHGRVRSVDRTIHYKDGRTYLYKGKSMKAWKDRRGYFVVTLHSGGKKKNKFIHRLVAEAFIGPCPDGMECLHGDGNKTNNHADNLRWGTSSENNLDTVRHGRHVNARKTHCPADHELTPENTSNWAKRAGVRKCLACERANSYVQRHPELRSSFQEIADRYHQAIIKGGS